MATRVYVGHWSTVHNQMVVYGIICKANGIDATFGGFIKWMQCVDRCHK